MKGIQITIISTLLCAAAQAGTSPFADLPACGVTCAAKNLKDSVCSPTDTKCLCGNVSWQFEIAGCILTGCSFNDMIDTAKAAFRICRESGVQVSLPGLPDITLGGEADSNSKSGSSEDAAASSSYPSGSGDVGMPMASTMNGSPTSAGTEYPVQTMETSQQAPEPQQSTAAPGTTKAPGGGYSAPPSPTTTMTVHPTMTVSPTSNSAAEIRTGGEMGLSALLGILLVMVI